jgi:phytoene dehydrogenase-like protein
MESFDVVVIGGGHNGLVTAGYLAKAGVSVLVLERRPFVGGACITEEPWPGFKINTFAYQSGLLRPQIVDDLELRRFGYEMILCDPQSFVPLPGGGSITFWLDERKDQKEIERFSVRDARVYPRYLQFWDHILDQIEPSMLTAPQPLPEFLSTFPAADAEELIRELFLRSARDFLDDWFESEELKGALSASAIIGTFDGPGTPGTAYILGHHNIGTLDGHHRVWGYSRGGMGQITQSMARAAEHFGARIQTRMGVKRILVKKGQAVGVETLEGKKIAAKAIASSVDAQTTLLKLLPQDELDSDVAQKIRRIRSRGACLKFNASLDELPKFTAASGPEKLVGAVDIAPSMDYLDRAYDQAKYGAFSENPYIDACFQSLLDPSVAPDGKHTMTCFVQYAPTKLAAGPWEDHREQVAETVLRTLEEFAPNIRRIVRDWQVITPADIEATLGMTGGNIDQGDITPDQVYTLRPIPGWANYRTPISGLYLCGASTHPGGGVLGAPGHNAAERILKDLLPAG